MTYQLSDNVQRGVLYLLKSDLEFFVQFVTLMHPEYFDFPSYGRIFGATREYYTKYLKLPTDAELVEYIKFTTPQNVKDDNDYREDLEQINTIDSSVFENRELVMDIVEQFAKRAKMAEAIKKSVALLEAGKHAEIETLVRDALLVSREVNVGQDYFSDVGDRIHRFFDKKIETRFRTVLDTCNTNLEGGMCAKELAMVVAPPGVGKSLYLVNQGARSIMDGKNVLYISCEMSEDKIANRFDSVLTYLKNSKLKEPQIQAQLKERLKMVAEKTPGRLVIKEYPTGTINVNNIRALLVQLNLHRKFVPDLIIVDYLELLQPSRRIDAEYMAQQRIAEELRGLAVEKNVLVWTASQTNRMARRVALITDAELGDSYGKIRPADWAISLNQTEEEYDKGQMRAFVMKARDSKQRYVVPVSVNYSTLKMSETNRDAEEKDSKE